MAWRELYAKDREPSLCVVGGVTGEVYPKERRNSDDQQERREELEILAFDVKRNNSQEHTETQQADVLDDRRDIASSFVGQLGRGRKNLYDADETKEEKHHPDDFVTLEYVSNFFVVHFLSLLKGRRQYSSGPYPLQASNLLLELCATVFHVVEEVETGAAGRKQNRVAGACHVVTCLHAILHVVSVAHGNA